MDFSTGSTKPVDPIISTVSPVSGAGLFSRLRYPTWASVSPGVAATYYIPLTLSGPFRLTTFWWYNGSSVFGKVNVGIYDSSGNLITSSGSVNQTGTSVIQSNDAPSPVLLTPGQYFLGLGNNNSSATFWGWNSGAVQGALCGIRKTLDYLPSSATLNTTGDYFLLYGISSVTVI